MSFQKQRDVMPLKPEKPTSEDKRTESEVEASGCVMQVVGYLPRDIFKEKYGSLSACMHPYG
jgi:hypothetical protein